VPPGNDHAIRPLLSFRATINQHGWPRCFSGQGLPAFDRFQKIGSNGLSRLDFNRDDPVSLVNEKVDLMT
jgi:hypothetical protein